MDLKIPKLGVAMQQATLVEWLVTDGENVTAGTPIYRIETEKVENEVEAPAAGIIHLVAQAGQVYSVGTTVAELG